MERHKDFGGNLGIQLFALHLCKNVEEIQEPSGFNLKKVMSHEVTRKGQCLVKRNLVKATLFDGSIQVDDIDPHLETDFGGVNFVKDDDSKSPF